MMESEQPWLSIAIPVLQEWQVTYGYGMSHLQLSRGLDAGITAARPFSDWLMGWRINSHGQV
jgi:hypothetical protein